MKILVFGGRDFKDWQRLYDILDNRLEQFGDDLIIIHGRCRTGADRYADQWADERMVDCLRVPAKWGRGKSAGHIRNRRMATKYKPDAAIQFPGGNGTANMRSLCDELGIPITEFTGKVSA